MTKQWVCATCDTGNYWWKAHCRGRGCNLPWKGDERVLPATRSTSAKRREREARRESELVQRITQQLQATGATGGVPAPSTSRTEQPTWTVQPTYVTRTTPSLQPPIPSISATAAQWAFTSEADKILEDAAKRSTKLTEHDKKLQGMKKSLADLEWAMGQDYEPAKQMRSDIQRMEAQRHEQLPLDTRISAESLRCQELTKERDDIDAKIAELTSQRQAVCAKLRIHNEKLAALQSSYHEEQTKLAKVTMPKDSEPAIRLALKRGDNEMYKALTGQDIPIYNAAQNTAVLQPGQREDGSFASQRSPRASPSASAQASSGAAALVPTKRPSALTPFRTRSSSRQRVAADRHIETPVEREEDQKEEAQTQSDEEMMQDSDLSTAMQVFRAAGGD
eukprot:TRINITY_DN124031_c0_g1_i1.p2 TRINITY_DN124031_c0_g1~~TRINITY_DN124031_c0_g1_i1.p2  ORF type:complete len:392 (-),score=97.75 TRINITY_DN124031_c0_g1_i1:303-1478(-)